MRLFLTPFFIFIFFTSFAQQKSTTVRYASINNGKLSEEARVKTIYQNGIVYLSEQDANLQSYIDYNKREVASILKTGSTRYAHIQPFEKLPQPRRDDKSETILGFNCKYAVFSAFSNTIEVWYTEEAGVPGSPNSSYIPSNKALVLKLIINGSRALQAVEIAANIQDPGLKYPIAEAKRVSEAELEGLKIKARYTVLPIFKDERINFDPSLKPSQDAALNLNQTYRFSKGSIILKKISLENVLKAGDQIFVDMRCWSDGDAYDRTGSVFWLPSGRSDSSMLAAFQHGLDRLPVYTDRAGKEYQGIRSENGYQTPVELMRFFTSFGVRHFNNLRPIAGYDWKDAAIYKQDVTEVFPSTSKEIYIGVFIGNYDKGGHKVNLDLNIYPSFQKKEKMTPLIVPLFNTINIMEMSGQNYGRLFKIDTLEVTFEVPKNAKNLKLLYTSTGHGGWGTGDEFTPTLNQIRVDGHLHFSMMPWRTDCASFRNFNPASGNFGNGMSSSDLSRSNWCPATPTPAYVIPLDGLEPGTHRLQLNIKQGDDQGTSFNHWSVSGTLVGDLEI
ncbi:PNGase F N-terminal domain-containing protein [Dyadobacter tibetensis]|uniref:PNGase F N-terminal domain-containing protein n=1 Tax=Dyadobacter tibetensis TaxID=1211851 RepID=UPI00046F25ED|nr:PNGase F N-terminal domain-containing protein [Dyadobacter tibetensis]